MQQTSEPKAKVIVIKPGDPIPPLVDLDEVSRDGPVFEGTDVPVQYMFEYLDRVHNLHAFLDDFPEVSIGQAVEAIQERVKANNVIHSNTDYVSGTPVFKGTRVPVRNLFDYLAAGYTIEVFLDQFPTAEREQVVSILESAREALECVAYETAAR